MKTNKIRKVELVLYGYGIRQIFEIETLNLQIENWDKSFKTMNPGELNEFLDQPSLFTLTGTIKKLKSVTKKYLNKWKKNDK